MGKFVDLTGQRFGKLRVLSRAENRKPGITLWLCECVCGRENNVTTMNLRGGKSRSCGHHGAGHQITHGQTASRTYRSWQGMKTRCYDTTHDGYKYYGGRGIRVCDRWISSFENFLADMGERPEGMTLDRANSDGNYDVSNCKWSTPTQQIHNRRPFNRSTDAGNVRRLADRNALIAQAAREGKPFEDIGRLHGIRANHVGKIAREHGIRRGIYRPRGKSTVTPSEAPV